MTTEERQAKTEYLYGKSIRELVEIILVQEEKLEEARLIRKRFMQVKNLLTEPEERKGRGRPKKEED